MEGKAKVTIITGYYNREDYVLDSIESLLNQSYQSIEIVAFDDCSTDNTYRLLKELEEKDNRLTVVRNESNKGFVRTLVDVIADIDTEFVAIHGSGDISLRHRIMTQVNYLQDNPNVGVVCGRALRLEDYQRDGDITGKNIEYVDTDRLLTKNPIIHGCVMFRRAAYDMVGGYRAFFTFGQDRDLWLRLSLVTKIVLLPSALYLFTKIETSDTVGRNAKKVLIQIMLSSFSTQLIQMRRKQGHDLIDLYGEKASLFFNPKSSTKKINKLILLQIYQNKINNARYLSSVSKNINPSLTNRLFLWAVGLCKNTTFLRGALQSIMHTRLKGKRVSDYKEISQG